MPIFIFVTWLTISVAQNTPTEGISDIINSVELKPSSRLDPYIRKALLKALSELEESDSETTGIESNNETSDIDISTQDTVIDFNDNIHSPKQGIQIHSFIVNGQSAFINNTNLTPTLLDDKISILSATAGNVENQVTGSQSKLTPYTKIYQNRDASVNNQQVRSISNSDLLTIQNEEKTSTTKRIPTTTRITTTTTTTPKPTHNDDGENIEEVDKRDVQVYQAPLVAAFTVHQDAQGLPKQVIPIYQHINDQQLRPLPTNNIPTSILPPDSIEYKTPQFNLNINQASQNDFINRQLTLQRELEEKQRILEEQLRLLQLQQRQQEELLQKQQFLLQQKEAQRLQQSIFDQDQQRRQQFQINRHVNNFSLQKNFQQSSTLNPNNSSVSIQASIPLTLNQPSDNLPVNQQQLPNREAVDFLLHLRNKHPEQFPLQENHLPQGISTFLKPNPTQNFQQGLNFNHAMPEQVGLKQNNRVFRQEAAIGNFGINNANYNRFNTFNPIQANRFFPQQNRPNQYNSDFELKQLLMQMGLTGRNPEDLNIVSKVLSLNHGIFLNNHVSNRLPFDSRRHVKAFF